ncbi:VWA domain-containing protein [uncultured Tessaracoccus sp.]|uniref:VWA domain-containing protein n=1 Tax=uncultured Tessaracoccus sp. TaxID=905023 RepID=UPI00260A20AD|nr:VWA domain-containing protein [uncultured Tessaracoccus sp.]
MSKRAFAALSAAALLATAGAGIASADNTDLFVEIQQPADQSVYPVGADVPVAGKVGAGADSTAKASVVFVVDASGSTLTRVNDKSVFEWEQDGGKALLKSLRGDSNAVQMGVVYFSDEAKGFGLSNNLQDVDEWLSYDHSSAGVSAWGTDCETGMAEANRLLDGVKGHKRIYFLTDGMCNGRQADLDAEVKKAKDAGIDVRSIHTTEASEQCKEDALQANECIYAADPSKLVAQLPGETKPTVETLKVTVTNDKGEVVKEADLSDEVGVAIIEDWKLGVLKNLPAGKYTVTAKATAQGGATATNVVTFTIGEAGDTASPEPTETPSPTPAPEPEKPGLPNTGC